MLFPFNLPQRSFRYYKLQSLHHFKPSITLISDPGTAIIGCVHDESHIKLKGNFILTVLAQVNLILSQGAFHIPFFIPDIEEWKEKMSLDIISAYQKSKSVLRCAVWDAVFQTCAVTVWTRRAGQAVPLAARSSWGLIGVQRTGSGSRFITEVAARQTVTVMTSRTQVRQRVACKQTNDILTDKML